MTVSRRHLLLALTASWALSACDAGGRPGAAGAGGGSVAGGAATAGTTGSPTTGAGTPSAPARPTPTWNPAVLPQRGPDGERVLNVVAHPDDDLLFLSPDLVRSIRDGAEVRTVFLTAGDAGQDATYWRGRIRGIRAAYAQLAGVADHWLPGELGPPGSTSLVLAAEPRICLVFLKLPDGGPANGYARYGFTSLRQLWRGEIATLTAVDGSAAYDRAGLIEALTEVMRSFGPDVVRTQDFLGRFGDGDHNDHHATAYLTREASRSYPEPHRLVAYQDYAVQTRPVDVPPELLVPKRAAFAAYSYGDPEVFVHRSPAAGYKAVFDAWLGRQYVLIVE